MARHAADGAWDGRADAELIRALRQWHAEHPLPGWPFAFGPASSYAAPLTPQERYAVRRRLDE